MANVGGITSWIVNRPNIGVEERVAYCDVTKIAGGGIVARIANLRVGSQRVKSGRFFKIDKKSG